MHKHSRVGLQHSNRCTFLDPVFPTGYPRHPSNTISHLSADTWITSWNTFLWISFTTKSRTSRLKARQDRLAVATILRCSAKLPLDVIPINCKKSQSFALVWGQLKRYSLNIRKRIHFKKSAKKVKV